MYCKRIPLQETPTSLDEEQYDGANNGSEQFTREDSIPEQ